MVLSKRERYVAIGTVAAIALFTLNSFVISPYMAKSEEVKKSLDDAQTKWDDGQRSIRRQKALTPVWAELQQGGLKMDASQAKLQAQHAIVDWARWAKIDDHDLAAIKPGRPTQQEKFQVIAYEITVHGKMADIAQLVWAMETSTIPMRVNEIHMTPTKEGTDDLTVGINVSSLCMPPETDSKDHQTVAINNMGERP